MHTVDTTVVHFMIFEAVGVRFRDSALELFGVGFFFFFAFYVFPPSLVSVNKGDKLSFPLHTWLH